MTEEGKLISAVLLDGKQVKFPIEWSSEEGWVKFEIPILHETTSITSGQTLMSIQDSDSNIVTWEIKKEFGNVELIYLDNID